MNPYSCGKNIANESSSGGGGGGGGATGATGATGSSGGPTGPSGPSGPTGPTGPTGADGANGSNGLDGASGPTGADGPSGPSGADGPSGLDGAPGPSGPTGADGANGSNGLDGASGPTGADGPSGPSGADGPTGVAITPASVTSSLIGQTWVAATTQPPLNTMGWYGVSVSSTGQYQTAVANNALIYISNDYGNTWTTTDSVRNWYGVSVSSTGQYQTAVVYGGLIYISADYGNTWVAATTPPEASQWYGVSVSSTGQYQTAVVFGGLIYISADYGNTWVAAITQPEASAWYGVSVSSTGQYQTAVVLGDLIYISNDYGNTWTATDSVRSWVSVSVSSTGQYQTAVVYGGLIYISNDYGNTWTATGSVRSWYGVSVSSTGQYQTAVVDYMALIYISADYGNSWIAANAPAQTWFSVSVSSTGQYQTAVSYFDGGIYTCRVDFGVTLSISSGVPATAANFLVSDASQIVYSNSSLSLCDGAIYTAANIYPATDVSYDLGSETNRFFNVYATNLHGTVDSVFLDGPGFRMHLTGTNRMLNIVDICDASTSAIPGTMQSQTCIVAVGNPNPGYSAIQFSTDGTSWNNLSGAGLPQSFTAGTDVAFDGNNNWVAVGQSGIVTSSTGNVWSTVTPETIQNVFPAAVCYSSFNNAWYTVGFDTCGRNTIKKCPSTGIQQTGQGGGGGGWTNAIGASSPSFFGSNAALVGQGNNGGSTIATNGGRMILAGGYASDNGSNSCILYADVLSDTSWSNAKSYETGSNLGGVCSCLAYNGEYWLAAHSDILLSRDGKTWKQAAAFTDNTIVAVEWSGQYWIASTLGQYVWRSYDGYTWTFMNPGFVGFTYCIGWNGLRLMVGGYNLGLSDSAIMSLKPTNTTWQPAVDAANPTVTGIFGQVNNFANRTLLPNAPIIPASAVITCNVVPPPTTLGKLGDYYNVPSATGLPGAYYGPKFEDTTYGSNGSVSFLLTSTISQAGVVTTNPSTGYIINTSDFAINWWMYSLEAASPIAVAAPKGSIIGFYDAVGLTFEVSISGDKGLYLNIDGNVASLNTTVSAKTWQYCTLTRNSSQSNGMVWRRGPTDLPNSTAQSGCPAVATSANGQYISVIAGGVHTSSNYGNTWVRRNTSAPSAYLNNIAMSSTGQYQSAVAVVANGSYPNPFYNSSDYGVTWTTLSFSTPSIGFRSIAMSSDGARRVVVRNGGGLMYTSSNYGSTWTSVSGSSNSWSFVAMSSTGQYITATSSNDTNVYISSDYGATISPKVAIIGAGDKFVSVAMSSTGEYQTTITEANGTYISSNYGSNWSRVNYDIFSNVVMNSTGQYQLTFSPQDFKIYRSSNYGANWVGTNSPTDGNWRDIAISSTGEYMYAFRSGGTGTSNFWTSGVNQGIKFYTGPVGGVAQLAYSSLQTDQSLVNTAGRFSIGYNPTSLLCNVLLTNIRVSTGFSDPLANFIPTSPLTSISGTKLLFTAPNSASGLVWADSSVYNTSMTLTTTLVSWTGFNPLQTITLSWGAQDPRTPFTFTGRGYPPGATVLATSLSGDVYMDVSGRYMYTYTLSADGVFGYY